MESKYSLHEFIALGYKLGELVIVLFTAAMLFFVCLQIFFRFFLNNALSWPEEAVVFLMVWFSLLAAVYVQQERSHIKLIFIYDKCSTRGKALIDIFNNCLLLVFFGVVVYQGILECISMIPLETSALRISRAIPYLSIPVTGTMFILVGIAQIIQDSLRLKNL